MAGETAEDALGSLLAAYQRVVSGVSDAVLLARLDPTDAHHYLLRPGEVDPIRLGRDRLFSLRIDVRLRVLSDADDARIWRAQPVAYRYELLNHDVREVIAYHWHPLGVSPVRVPHLHVGGRTEPIDLSKVHLPTGVIDMCDVAACLVTEFGVRPLRLDWQRVIDDARRRIDPR